MKGILHKTESGWQVWYHAKDDLYHGSIRVRILPILDHGYVNGPGLSDSNEGLKVEFEIVSNEGEPLGKGEQPYKQYAKLVDKVFVPMKGGEGWDKILDKAIQDKAEAFTDGHYHYRGKDAFIKGYKQGQEDTKGMRYTEEDMREMYAYAKNDNTNLENYLQALNKQDSEWITIKGDNITVNFKPMPEFDDPKYPDYPTRPEQLREQVWDTIWKDFRANKNASYSWALLEYLRDNYNPPTKKQD